MASFQTYYTFYFWDGAAKLLLGSGPKGPSRRQTSSAQSIEWLRHSMPVQQLDYMRTGPLGQSELLDYTNYGHWPLASGLIGIRGNPSGCPYSPILTRPSFAWSSQNREYFLDLLTKLPRRSNSLVNQGSIPWIFWAHAQWASHLRPLSWAQDFYCSTMRNAVKAIS